MPRHSSKSHSFSSFLGSINSACSQPKSRGADQGPKGPCCCWNIWPPRGSAHLCSHVPSPIDADTDELTSTNVPALRKATGAILFLCPQPCFSPSVRLSPSLSHAYAHRHTLTGTLLPPLFQLPSAVQLTLPKGQIKALENPTAGDQGH